MSESDHATLPGAASQVNPTAQFLSLVTRYETSVRDAGKHVRATNATAPGSLFAALEPQRQTEVLARISSELAIFDEILAEGYRLTDSPRFLWRYLVRAGLTPRGDLFQRIQDDDVVVFYDKNLIHSFQNLNFFDFVSTTLEQLYCTPVYGYSRRNPTIEQRMYELAVKMAAGDILETIDPELPEHLVEEVDTESLLKFNMKFKWMSPVFSGGELRGIVTILACHAVTVP